MVTRLLARKARRDLRRQWPQFTAVVLTILLGVALFTASFDASRNLEASYREMFVRTDFPHLWVDGGDVQAFAHVARSTDGVAAATTRVVADVPLRIGDRALQGRIVSLPGGAAEGGPAPGGVVVLEGRLPTAAPPDAGTAAGGPAGVALEQHVADHFGVTPGDRIAVHAPAPSTAGASAGRWQQVRVDAVVASAEYLWPAKSRQEILTLPQNFGVVFAPRQVARELTGAVPNQVLVRVADPAQAGDVLAALRHEALRLGAVDVSDRAAQPSNSILQEDLSGFSQLSVAFPALFLTAAALATYVLLVRRVQRERELIGTLAALGLSRRTILGHYLSFGAAAGAVGSVLGSALGLLTAQRLTRVYTGFIDLPVTVTQIRPVTIAVGLGIGVATGMVAALLPARAAAAVAPAEAMRGIVPAAGGRRSIFERLVPPLRHAPATWRFVLRNLGRSRRRTAMTIVGTMLALLLVVTSWAMLDTISVLTDTQFGTVDRQDATAVLAAPGRPDLGALRAVPDVERVEAMAEVPVTLRSGDDLYATSLRVLPMDTQLQGLPAPGGGSHAPPEDGVLLGTATQDLLGLREGGDVVVQVTAGAGPAGPDGPADGGATSTAVTMRVRGFVDAPLGTFAYTSFSAAERLGLPGATAALLGFAPDADPAAVRADVTGLPGVVAYVDVDAVQQLVVDFTGLFRGIVGAMLALGAVMAFAIIFTTMSVNVLDRSREVATLRAGGVGGGVLGRLITAENLLVTLMGVVPGLVVGVVGAAGMLRLYSNDQFSLDLVVRPSTLVVSAAVILAVAGVSQWPGLRAVRRLDIARVVRERQA